MFITDLGSYYALAKLKYVKNIQLKVVVKVFSKVSLGILSFV